jgi:hypothetical protein
MQEGPLKPITPGSILPARELLAELLFDLGRPGEALKEFEASLRRTGFAWRDEV